MSALACIPGIFQFWRLPKRSDLLLSLVHFQVLLGLIQLLFAYHSPEWAARKMESNALIADHAIFNQAALTEIRPGRSVMLLDLTAPNPDVIVDGADQDEPWTVFFVHGSMATMQQFEAQITELYGSGNCRVVAFDAYGCGKSPRPTDFTAYSKDNLFQDLLAVFDRYKGFKNLVVGHSYGCSQVVQLANARGEDVHGITLIAPGFAPTNGEPPMMKAVKVFSAPLIFLNIIRPLLSRGFAERSFHARTRTESCDHHRRLLQRAAAFSGSNSMHVCQAFYQQMEWVKAADIDRIPCAVLLVVGEGDKICQVRYSLGIKEILAQKPSRLVRYHEVPEASHQVMQERPEQVCAYLADFLRSLEGGGGVGDGALDTETVQM